jgi:hypothetical protein
VEDQDKIQSDEDVEAHKKIKLNATDEGSGSEEGSEDFELHKKKLKANDEGGESPDEDFELHKRRT